MEHVYVLTRRESIEWEGTYTFVMGVYSDYTLASQARDEYELMHRSNGYMSIDWDILTFKVNG